MAREIHNYAKLKMALRSVGLCFDIRRKALCGVLLNKGTAAYLFIYFLKNILKGEGHDSKRGVAVAVGDG
jgi:hypothetical protein